jgi:hypothetical protein
MAHALLMSKTLEEFKDKFFSVYFDKWLSVTHDEFMKLEKHEASFFRDYAGTNRQEFLPCAWNVSLKPRPSLKKSTRKFTAKPAYCSTRILPWHLTAALQ